MISKGVFMAALAVICMVSVSAEFYSQENEVLKSEFELQSLNSALELEENIRQKRDEISSSKNRKNRRKKKNKMPRKSKKNRQRKNRNKPKENKRKHKQNKKGKKSKKNKVNRGRNKKTKRRGNSSARREKNKDAKKAKKGAKNNKNKKARKTKDMKKQRKSGKSRKNNNKNSRKGRNKKNQTKSKKKVMKNENKRRTKKNKKINNREQNKENKKSKTAKINRKKKKSTKKTKFSRTNRQATVNLTCLRDAVTYTKFLKDNVINFLRRNTRLKRQNNVTNKKAAKKGEFKEPAARLIQAGGGDRTNLSCSGSTTSSGAKKLKSTIDTLDACNAAIDKVCKPPTTSNESSELKTCGKNAVDFNTTVSKCIKMATEGKDACSCFQAPEVAKDQKNLRKCKGTSAAKAAAAQRTKCLKEVQKCKAAATTAGLLQYACLFKSEELLKTLKQLNSNQKAIKAFLEKIKKLTGLSPNLPGAPTNKTLSGRHKEARSVEVEDEDEDVVDSPQARVRGKRQEVSCSSVVATITTCTTTLTNTPASIKVETSCKSPTYTISTCSTDDNTNIQKALDALLEADTIIIAFMDSIKSELKETTGSTPSPGDLTATAKAAVRSRSLLRKMIMEKMQIRN